MAAMKKNRNIFLLFSVVVLNRIDCICYFQETVRRPAGSEMFLISPDTEITNLQHSVESIKKELYQDPSGFFGTKLNIIFMTSAAFKETSL